MTDLFYCKLYIDTDDDRDSLEQLLASQAAIAFGDLNVDVDVRRNEDFVAPARSATPYDFILASRFYVDVGLADENIDDVAGFQFGITQLISQMRDGQRIVTASCDFEAAIIAATGWNWTRDNPEPPSRRA